MEEPGVIEAPEVSADEGHPTLERQTRVLLGELPSMNAYEVARLLGSNAARVVQLWRTLGFAGVPAASRVFTSTDVEALQAAFRLADELGVSDVALRELLRGAAHSAERLAVWQLEALVEDAERRFQLDDVSARLVVLDSVGQLVPELELLGRHAWRRHLHALLTRTETAVGRAGKQVPTDALPLERAIGFLDVVAYTSRTQELGAVALAELISAFEERARDVIIGAGGRVVKTMGDGVLFVADDIRTGLLAALALGEGYGDSPVPLEVHGAFIWGRILPRSGDVFGPSVNLASRLADVAHSGQLLTDQPTWELIEASGLTSLVSGRQLEEMTIAGIGPVEPVVLERSQGS